MGVTGKARRFGRRARAALFLASGGLCSSCGKALDRGWHADHVVPWSRGGDTDVSNGQALCPACNTRKGNSMLKAWPASLQLREWQQSGFDKWIVSKSKDFTVEAYPGAGKTIFALRCAHQFLLDNPGGLVSIVVPTAYLKQQWAHEAAKVGIDIAPDWTAASGAIVSGCHGVAATYAAVSSSPESFRYLCRRPMLLISDEIHHCGDDQSWGRGMLDAFGGIAKSRIAITGTPWRTSGEKIPFVSYDEFGILSRDVSFGYAEALDAGISRPLFFPAFEGRMKWYTRGQERIATFADSIAKEEDGKRLRTALMADGDWMRRVLIEADRKLTLIRESHADAGGLILAMDQRHAQDIADALRKLTNRTAVVVTSDNADASALIDRFRDSDERWIIAVRMVSEGVDIKRLRVGVYATNYVTEMFFTQAVNRLSRTIPGLDYQAAFWFIPDDPRIVELAKTVISIRQFQIAAEADRSLRDPGPEVSDDRVASPFLPISSTGESNGVIHAGDRYEEAEREHARKLLAKAGAPAFHDPDMIVKVLRAYREECGEFVGTTKPPASPDFADPPYLIRKNLSREVNKLVNTLCAMTDQSQKEVHGRLKSIDGQTAGTATIDHHKARIQRLSGWIKEAYDGR